MYTKLSAEDFKRSLDLPKDYQVEGLLACGFWGSLRQRKTFAAFEKREDALELQ